MRNQLDEANKNVSAIKNIVRCAERNLNVSEQDKDSLRKSLARNVGKIESLMVSARTMRAHRATMKEGINDIIRKTKSGRRLCPPCICTTCLVLI
jgi:hypothetical protein